MAPISSPRQSTPMLPRSFFVLCAPPGRQHSHSTEYGTPNVPRGKEAPHNLERPVSLACWRSDATSPAWRGAPDRFFSSSGDDAGCQLARSSPL
ncbi:hypothetical protein NDU88_006381 [Pleurodeles waltl]|uniref:Uncharacterized protein n=1 Tax=Pleurodeles waltl TaxID=8319 RepID=A0AAV7RPD4_PLEWA|nr:hypothetical protein NDU88_006381 [Pleurodeles waltl]